MASRLAYSLVAGALASALPARHEPMHLYNKPGAGDNATLYGLECANVCDGLACPGGFHTAVDYMSCKCECLPLGMQAPGPTGSGSGGSSGGSGGSGGSSSNGGSGGGGGSSPVNWNDDGAFKLSAKDLVFFIGPNKAGTTSMEDYYEQMSWTPCHNMCADGTTWWKESFSHDGSNPIWKAHRVFMDNGDHADYEWLYNTFDHSRFVMNVRPLRDWVLSRYDMVRQIRLNGGCSPQGTSASCAQGWYGTPSDVETWTGNSDADIRSWIAKLAEVQVQQLSFFDANPVRQNRFVMLDVTDSENQDITLRRLAWAQRKDLADYHTDHLLMMNTELPGDLPFLEVDRLSGPHAVPHALGAPHPASSLRHVESVLRSMGCYEDTWGQYIYDQCRNAILASGLELAELPSTPFPSSRRAMPLPIGTYPADATTLNP